MAEGAYSASFYWSLRKWLSKCRAVLVRYDNKVSNYLGVLQLACALLWFRRQWRLSIILMVSPAKADRKQS